MATLFLTKDERAVYDKLPESIRTGHDVNNETIAFTDSEEKMAIRLRNLKLTDPKILALKDKASSIKTQEDFTKLVGSIDFSTVAQDDLIELYFAMGPDALTGFIAEGLKNVKSAEDFMSLVALTIIRHGLLISLTSSPVA